jgi:hypothetical protein
MLKSFPFVATLLAIAAICRQTGLATEALYSTLPGALPPNLPSLGYQATQTAEFGGLVQTASGGLLATATVAMSDWALESSFEPVGTSAGFSHGLTLTIYAVGSGNTVGSVLGSVTTDAFIPWRPEASAGCGTAYRAVDGNCYNGSLSLVTFDFSALGFELPSEFIYGLAYDTETWGANPTGVDGPYDSLNFGLSMTEPSVGSQPLPGTAYWNTSTASDYADGGVRGVATFRLDSNWTPYSGAIEFDGSAPEPSTCVLIGFGLLGFGSLRRHR